MSRDLEGPPIKKVPPEAFAEASRASLNSEHGDELYDLAADPAEAHNLIADPAAQDTLRDLRSRLLAWMQRNAHPALSWRASGDLMQSLVTL